MNLSLPAALSVVLLSWCLMAEGQRIQDTLNKDLAALTRQIQADPTKAEAYHQRGCVNFKLANFSASLADFDKYIALKPAAKAGHWQRGISCYYAGHFEEGRRQFEAYQDVDKNDVENAVWRYLCMAKSMGIPKARQAMLKIGDDRRVPMRQVYEMYSGRLKPEEVIAAAQAGKPTEEVLKRQLFYAHLYVGIHYHLEGKIDLALEHLNKAAGEYRISHYMGDVARVHRDLLAKEIAGKKN
jgi:lipoprotein NlpI